MSLAVLKTLGKIRSGSRAKMVRTFTDKRNGRRRVKTFCSTRQDAMKLARAYQDHGVECVVNHPKRTKTVGPSGPGSYWGIWSTVIVVVPDMGVRRPRHGVES
jgi:hypothetical protein